MQVLFQNHLGIYLDGRLDFSENLQNIFKKTKKKKTGLLRNPQNNILRAPLVTIYKSLIRPYLHYQDILYSQTFNIFFHEKLETI